MTVRYTADVFCDKCGNWIHGAVGDKPAGLARKAVKVAKAEGWSRSTRSILPDLCPPCLGEERRSDGS